MSPSPSVARSLSALVAALFAVAPAPVAPPASQPAPKPAPAPTTKADLLARAVLADPMDGIVREQLEALRVEQRRARTAAFGTLAQGLHAYLEAGPELAAAILRQVARSPRAASLARPLGPAIQRIVAADEPNPPARSATPCPKCGDTGLADCTARRCHGSGWVPCGTCKGSGVVQVKDEVRGRTVLYLCRDCAGSGVTRCPACNGHGTVACKACNRQPGRWAEYHVSGQEAAAVEKVICQARWLHRGGIDLYTNGALKPSPK